MNYLAVENVTKYIGERLLFEDITFHINEGQKVAFVAKNGTGKSTLLRIMSGEEGADNGTVMFHKNVKWGMLSQEPVLMDELSVFEAVYLSSNPVMKAIAAYDKAVTAESEGDELQHVLSEMDRLEAWDYEVKVKTILSKLKIDFFERKVGLLSGGQRKRLALAKILIDDPDFLILDEPTNHLDLEMIEWLEDYLKKHKTTIFMVTHDRYFLEAVCETILELDDMQIFKYNGNYSYYLQKKSERQENIAVNTDRAKQLYRKELDWMRKQPKARGTKAKSRIDKFFEIEKKAKKRIDSDTVEIEIKMNRLGGKVLEIYNLNKAYGDFKIVDGFEYKFKKGDRVGIVGKNGVGKTTFLELITGRMQPDSGKVVIGDTVVMGYYTQSGMNIKEGKRVIDVIQDIAEYLPLEGGRKLSALQLLERFLFDRRQQQTRVENLSGGEKRRLYLLTILMQNPNFLILDEPTNDLDIMTLQVLEEFLHTFKGCIIIVSHDRHFMDRLIDHTFVLEGQGIVRDYPCNYSEYRRRAAIEEQERKQLAKENALPKEKREKPKQEAKLSYEERKEFNRLEKEIAKLEDKKAKLSERFNDPDLSGEDMNDLSKELGEMVKSIEEKEERWMELAELA